MHYNSPSDITEANAHALSLKYSVIVPVFNRPDEIDELLASLASQEYKNFEVLIIEDGSSKRCDDVVDRFRDRLAIRYFFKANSGPGPSRNFGFEHASGDYFVVFDSDCIIPHQYLMAVETGLAAAHWDAWGGPDKAHRNFTLLQRAMGYTMSSILTTGGIRGAKKHVGAFQPRSFNMGLSRRVFETTGGFTFTHFAEDIELSIRMVKANFKVGLIPEAFVFHKRRATLGQFYQQVFNFGRGRALVGRAHPSEIKLTHWFPSFFAVASLAMLIIPLFSLPMFYTAFSVFAIYLLAILIDGTRQSRDLRVGMLSVPAALIQLCGYGLGFLVTRLGLIQESR